MVQGGTVYKITTVIILLPGLLLHKLPVQAEEYSMPPHLMQSVSGQDIYESGLALALFHTPVLGEPDTEAACETVKDTVVRIDMGNAYGSGVIFRVEAEGIVIATNRHVLEYWREESGVIRLAQGYYVSARLLGSAASCDVGFLLVDTDELGVETLLQMRSVYAGEEAYRSLRGGEEAFCLGADRETQETVFHKMQVEDTDRYIALFGGEMLYGHGFAKEGMSGGGIFDSYGRLIGLLAGGTWQDEVAGVPVDQVMQAYREVAGE